LQKKIACRELLSLTGELSYEGEVIHPIADHPATMWITAYKSLCRMDELAEQHDVIYNLERLNTVLDHPGYPLARPNDAVHLLREVGSPRIKILLDIYHTQMQQGNVIQFLNDRIHPRG
jgi:hydroxypyruvate isomerase